MTFQALPDVLKSINSATSLKEVGNALSSHFTLTAINITGNRITKARGNGKTKYDISNIKVTHVQDAYGDLSVLIGNGKLLLNTYKNWLSQFLNTPNLTINEKRHQLTLVNYSFSQFRGFHNYHGYFAFTTQPIFYLLSSKKEPEEVTFDELTLTEVDLTQVREIFNVRFDFFDELNNITNLFIQELELQVFKYAKFKLKEEEGSRLLWEFVFAITANNNFIELSQDQKKIFEKEVFEFFGIPYKNRGKAINNLFRKGRGLSKGLKQLRDTFNEIAKEDLKH